MNTQNNPNLRSKERKYLTFRFGELDFKSFKKPTKNIGLESLDKTTFFPFPPFNL